MNGCIRNRTIVLAVIMLAIIAASTRLKADTGTCGGASISLPFTDVPSTNVFFCSIAEAFFSGLSNGTSPTTYSPAADVTREQMAAFVTRTMDQSLKRGSRRAALKQFWTPTILPDSLGVTTVGGSPQLVESDGADLWVPSFDSGTVSRIRASDGQLLGTWTGATGAYGVLSAKGMIFVTGYTNPGKLYQIDPTQPPGAVTTLPISLGSFPQGLCFDGERIWTANGFGTVSIVSLSPASVTTATGFDAPTGILYDGANTWVVDFGAASLYKLDSTGAIIQTVFVGGGAQFPAFDGTNIWVPNSTSNSVTVVRASTGAVLATLTGNGLGNPNNAAFDGERILITNPIANIVSLWKATDLSPLGFVFTDLPIHPFGVCSDGLNFWVTLQGTNQLARF